MGNLCSLIEDAPINPTPSPPPLPPVDPSELQQETVNCDYTQEGRQKKQAKWETVPLPHQQFMKEYVKQIIVKETPNVADTGSIVIPKFRHNLREEFGGLNISVLYSHAIHEVLKETQFPHP